MSSWALYVGPSCLVWVGLVWREAVVRQTPEGSGARLEIAACDSRAGRTARAGKMGQAFTLLLKVQVRREGLGSFCCLRVTRGWPKNPLPP